ncbi:MAG: hypothetical protein IJK66_01445 [Bacilli bacterium]|nr:hypothetical protein [Bacilli bacterium]
MELFGYKCFNANGKNRYGIDIREGIIYSTDKDVRYGNDGHGYHFCTNMEDTFRFFKSDKSNLCEDIFICEVRAFGEIREREQDRVVEVDDGYYGLYAAQNLEILKILTREEIIEYGLNLSPDRTVRFVSGLKLSDEEIERFREKYKASYIVNDAIDYYQLNDKDVYNRRFLLKR